MIAQDHDRKVETTMRPNIAGQFDTFDDWVRHATGALANKTCESSGCETPVPAMCVDTKGRRCYQGGDFTRARDEGAFPVSYFWDCTPEDLAMAENEIKTKTVITDGDGTEVTVKHYRDGAIMITQDDGGKDRVYVPAEQYAEFIKAVTRV